MDVKTVTMFGVILSLIITVTSAWDSDAGVTRSLTKSSAARVFASSRDYEAAMANDGSDGTHWTSFGCLPGYFYIQNALTNVLYDACREGRCTSSSPDISDIVRVTDDSLNTAYQVRRGREGEQATFTITLRVPDGLRYVTVRGSFTAPTQVMLTDGEGTEKVIATLTSSDTYQTRDFNVTLTPATSVTLRSWEDFSLQGVAAIGQGGCRERLYVDMGAPQAVRLVRTRHWPGKRGLTSQLVTSQDGVTWRRLTWLDPTALQSVVTVLNVTQTFRYVGVEHRHEESNYDKVYVWEVDAYPDGGLHGAPPPPLPHPLSLRQMLGVNAIWGWGWGRASDHLPPGQGAELYAPVASYARNYHNLNWDIRDPDTAPDYDRMARGQGTNAQWWLNWDTEYSQWLSANVSVHVSVQFLARTLPVSVWDHPYNASRQYGYNFARHFGASHGTGMVRSVEVGNEPWDYPALFYTTVLDGMASGFKAADPQMVVMPGAFQAHDPSSTGNYIGTRVTQQVANNIDVINSHHYSWRRHSDGSRRATYPEDPAGSFREVQAVIRWRDTNTPSKPLWVTEWGWDSPGGGQQCSKFPECTTEAAASAYAARGLLLLARLGVARAAWFFYGNLDYCDSHVFCRSGLTSSKSAHFVKKGPYYTLQHLLHLIGNSHFLDVVREDEDAYVYEFGILHPDFSLPIPTHIVAWRPVDAEAAGDREIPITFNTFAGMPVRAWRLRMDQQPEAETALPLVDGTEWTMVVSAMPTVVQLSQGAIIG
ncbi:hypothetical protein ACOMHN_035990 [Nucella lapillus]